MSVRECRVIPVGQEFGPIADYIEWTRMVGPKNPRGASRGQHAAPPEIRPEITFILRGWAEIETLKGARANLKGPCLLGLSPKATHTNLSPDLEAISVGFKPYAMKSLLGVRASHLVDQYIPLSSILGAEADRISDRLLNARTLEERLGLIREWLRKAQRRPEPPPAVREALGLIWRSCGTMRMADLNDRIGLSAERLWRLFLEHVGVSPKAVSRIARIQRARRVMESAQRVDFGQIVHDFGFSDQAHFIREHSHFFGASPSSK